MSRSYRKNLWITDYSKIRRFFKGQANRRVRRAKDVPNGNGYRKYYDSWDICDWKFYYEPHPRYYSWGGELKKIDPEPLWKYRCK